MTKRHTAEEILKHLGEVHDPESDEGKQEAAAAPLILAVMTGANYDVLCGIEEQLRLLTFTIQNLNRTVHAAATKGMTIQEKGIVEPPLDFAVPDHEAES